MKLPLTERSILDRRSNEDGSEPMAESSNTLVGGRVEQWSVIMGIPSHRHARSASTTSPPAGSAG